MKLNSQLIKALILEVLNEVEVRDKYGHLVSPGVLKYKYPSTGGDEKKFFDIIHPVLSVLSNYPNEYYYFVTDALQIVIGPENVRHGMKDMTDEELNNRFQNDKVLINLNRHFNDNNITGLTREQKKDFMILAYKERDLFTSSSKIIKLYNNLRETYDKSGIVAKNIPTKDPAPFDPREPQTEPEGPRGPKTVNMKRPGIFEQATNNKKMKVKYKCN